MWYEQARDMKICTGREKREMIKEGLWNNEEKSEF